MKFSHTVIWLDHKHAVVIGFDSENSHVEHVKSHSDAHLHHRSGSVGSGHAPVDERYLEAVVSLAGSNSEILITGPASAKLELVKHIHKRHQATVERLVGVETVDHPSEGQLLKFARQYFVGADRMRPGTGISVAPK